LATERLIPSMGNQTKEIVFLVQGSNPEPYKIRFIKSDLIFSAFCTCPAGQKGMHCKHRINILTGSVNAIVSDNIEEVATIKKWLIGTPIEEAIQLFQSAEKECLSAKKASTKAKKNLSKALRGEGP